MAARGRANSDGNDGGKQAKTWVIVAVVVILLTVLFFWLFDFGGSEVDVNAPEVDSELESPDFDVDTEETPEVGVEG